MAIAMLFSFFQANKYSWSIKIIENLLKYIFN